MSTLFYIDISAENSGGGGSGVSSLNGLIGTLSLVGGSGISITPGGTDITIAATGSGSGTVTSVSVVSANGLAGTVATATTTPAITLSTSITGILQGDGTAISAATVGNLTDVGTDGITIGSGSGAVLGSGTTISQHVADTTHNGYLASVDWNTFNGKQSSGNYLTALTGDGSASGPGSAALTLATVNANIGSFGSASASPNFTVNAKGLITAAASSSIQIAETQVTNLVSDLAGKQPTGNYLTALTGQVTASGPGSSTATIATNTVTNSNLAQMTANTVKANTTGGTANASDVSLGTVTESTSSVLTLSSWADATIGSPTIEVKQSSTSQSGYLSSTDWNTFNGKQASGSYLTALTGDGTASGPGSAAFTLATVATGATVGSSTSIPSIVFNNKGLVTSASGNAVVAPAGTLSGTTLNSTVVSSSLTSVGTLASLSVTGLSTLTLGYATPSVTNATAGPFNNLAANPYTRLTNGSALTLNGIAAGADGQVIYVLVTSSTLTITALSGSATGAQIQTPGATNKTLSQNATAVFQYDATSGEWRLVSFL